MRIDSTQMAFQSCVNVDREIDIPTAAAATDHGRISIVKRLPKSATTDGTNKNELSNSDRVITSLAAGALAGSIAKTVIAPLDRAKINFQISKMTFSQREVIKFLIRSYNNDGLMSLWRGNSATLARVMPYAAIQFAAHEEWKRVLRVDADVGVGQQAVHEYRRVLAGSLAGVTAVSFTYPLDMARARLAVTHKEMYKSLHQMFSKIWREEGVRTLFRGYTPTLVGVIPYAGASFFTKETLERLILERSGNAHVGPLDRLFCGAAAGLIGQTASYPLDIVRRRMQTSRIVGTEYKSIWSTLVKVVRDEGIIGGLYKGLSLNWIKGPVAAAISFSAFDTLLPFLRGMPLFWSR